MTSLASQSGHALADRSTPLVWLPEQAMRRYQLAKIVGSLFFVAIFLGWMLIQWSSPVMRFVAMALVATTAWVTLASCLSDARRNRLRHLSLAGNAVGTLTLTLRTPDNTLSIELDRVATGEWREAPDTDHGLWLLDAHNRPLLHLDELVLAHEAEARTWLAWLRQHTDIAFPVRWPTPTDL